MTAFASQEASEARSRARQRQEPDADGFITVTRGGRTNPVRQEVAQEQAEKQKQKQKGLEDFYRFQSREKRKQKAGELIRKFEEDKEKIRKMRERRGRFRVCSHDILLSFPRMLMMLYSLNKPISVHPLPRTIIVSVCVITTLALNGEKETEYDSGPACFYLVSPPFLSGFAVASPPSIVHMT